MEDNLLHWTTVAYPAIRAMARNLSAPPGKYSHLIIPTKDGAPAAADPLPDPGASPEMLSDEDITRLPPDEIDRYLRVYPLQLKAYQISLDAYEKQEFAIAQALQYLHLLLPAGDAHVWREQACSTLTAFETATPKEIIAGLIAHFQNNVDFHTLRSQHIGQLESLQFKYTDQNSFPIFLATFSKLVSFINEISDKADELSDTAQANYLLVALRKNPDLQKQVEFKTQIFAYEQANKGPNERDISGVLEIARPCVALIPSQRTTAKFGYANMMNQATLASDDDDSNDGTAYVARKLTTGTVPPHAPLTTAASVTITAADITTLNNHLQKLSERHDRRPRTKPQRAGGQPAMAQPLPPSVSPTPAASGKQRSIYCWSCGTTQGPNAHTSRKCPKPRAGHQPECAYHNRESYPGHAVPTKLGP